MPDKVKILFLVVDAVFAASGSVLLAIVLLTRASMNRPRTTENVASNVLLIDTPLDGRQARHLL
jgi:hypothetical protein